MAIPPHILAALSGALAAYIQEEEALLAAAAPPGRPAPLPPANLWGASGRQWTMQTRQLLQRRSLK